MDMRKSRLVKEKQELISATFSLIPETLNFNSVKMFAKEYGDILILLQ